MYHEGQLVSCIVLQVDDDKKELAQRKIWLSLRLSVLYKSLTLDSIQEGMVCSFKGVALYTHYICLKKFCLDFHSILLLFISV